jgi:hypothetical protein
VTVADSFPWTDDESNVRDREAAAHVNPPGGITGREEKGQRRSRSFPGHFRIGKSERFCKVGRARPRSINGFVAGRCEPGKKSRARGGRRSWGLAATRAFESLRVYSVATASIRWPSYKGAHQVLRRQWRRDRVAASTPRQPHVVAVADSEGGRGWRGGGSGSLSLSVCVRTRASQPSHAGKGPGKLRGRREHRRNPVEARGRDSRGLPELSRPIVLGSVANPGAGAGIDLHVVSTPLARLSPLLTPPPHHHPPKSARSLSAASASSAHRSIYLSIYLSIPVPINSLFSVGAAIMRNLGHC